MIYYEIVIDDKIVAIEWQDGKDGGIYKIYADGELLDSRIFNYGTDYIISDDINDFNLQVKEAIGVFAYKKNHHLEKLICEIRLNKIRKLKEKIRHGQDNN